MGLVSRKWILRRGVLYGMNTTASYIFPEPSILLEIDKLAILAMLDSQPSLGSGRASYPNCMINRTAPGELLENQFMLPEYS